jgi:hypothetical protein
LRGEKATKKNEIFQTICGRDTKKTLQFDAIGDIIN